MSDRVKFGVWGVGVLAVFLFHVWALVDTAAAGGEHGALVWSILLLIAAPVTVVLLIGGGFVRLAGGDGPGGDDQGANSEADT